MSDGRPQAYQRLAELLIGARIAMALRVVAECRIADVLATGPKSAEELSSVTGIRDSSLHHIGGGQGHIIAAILQQHPGLHGALLDLPPTAEVARTFLAGQGLSPRCDVFAGDFFTAVPAGYDAYVIKSVLHDWDDDKA